MFASKTLAERNNDPLPYSVGSPVHGMDLRMAGVPQLPVQWCDHDPRPEFQYGILPANPILVEFRANGGRNIMWRDLPRFPTDDEKDFANRVLHLLSVLRESNHPVHNKYGSDGHDR